MASNEEQRRYEQLVRQWLTTASQPAWEELWERLFPFLVRAAGTVLVDEDDQIDVASEAFVSKITNNLDRYDPTKAKFTTWCWSIVQNLARDTLRRRHADQLDDAQAALLEATPDSTAGEVGTIAGYVVFRLADEAIREIVQVWMVHGSQPTPQAQRAVEAILDAHDAAWRRHGCIQDLTSFLFALIRLSKLTAADREEALQRLDGISPNTPAGFLIPFIGREATALLLLLFGGTALLLPPMGSLKR